MAVIQRSAIVRQSVWRMFDLVNDVAGYPRRFGWCERTQVLSVSDTQMLARLELRVAGMRTSFVTRNALTRPERIELALEEGPFQHLRGAWSFLALADAACKVSLEMDFQPAGKLLGPTLALGFERVADRMVDDFCKVALREAV